MIIVKNKKDCCGCSACKQICLHNAIEMLPDEEGFLYPSVNKESCVNCGQCEKVCPFQNPFDKVIPIKVNAFVNNNELIYKTSTSGGAFTAIADIVIRQGGVVFGVRFNDNWQAIYAKAETYEDLMAFSGPKYVQASVDSSYADCNNELKSGRQVLFCGTPCQIAGLKHYLRKNYVNLLTVEIICHGVPSPRVWNAYLYNLSGNVDNIKLINLRNKTGDGDNRYLIKGKDNIYFDAPAASSPYSQGFIRNYYLRPSCYNCKAKEGRSSADFTIGDCWGIKQIDDKFDNKYGVSTIIFNNQKSFTFREAVLSQGHSINIELNFVVKKNPSYKYPAKLPASRAWFWNKFKTDGVDAISATIKRDNNVIRKIVKKIKSQI